MEHWQNGKERMVVMELSDVIRGRRSVRKFTDSPVPKETMEKILEVVDYCPNAGNRNSTKIVVITDRTVFDYIGKAHMQIIQNFNKGITRLPSEEDIAASASAFHNAQAVVALFGPKNFYFSSADAYIMAQNITLAAFEQNVSTCIVGEVLNSLATERGKQLQNKMGIPEEFAPQAFVTMGYCDGEYPKHPKRRYSDVIYV